MTQLHFLCEINNPIHAEVVDTAGCLPKLYSPLPNRTLTLSSIFPIPTSRGSWSWSSPEQSMPTVQQSRGEDRTFTVSIRLGRILSQAVLTFHSFSWTWARRHVALTTTSKHAATHKGTLDTYGQWHLWWQRRETEDSGSLTTSTESLISPSETCSNFAFLVKLGCKFPYYLSHTGFSAEVYCYL